MITVITFSYSFSVNVTVIDILNLEL